MYGRRIDADAVLEKLDAYLAKNDYNAAKQHLLYWLGEAEAMSDHKTVLLLCNELMGLFRKLGERDNAFFYVKKALGQIQKMKIELNVGAATTYLNCATVYKAFERAQDALPLYEKAKMIYEHNLPRYDERLGGLYNNMGLALSDAKRFEEANALFHQALDVMAGIPEREPEQAITYLNMATAVETQLGLENAEPVIAGYVEKAMALLDVGKDRTDGNYAFVCEKCASVFGYYGYFTYEQALTERYRRIYEGA